MATRAKAVMALALLLGIVSFDRSSDADVITECMNYGPGSWDEHAPQYVIAGMSFLRITGSGTSSINHEAFFDGLLNGDSFSQAVNWLAGSHDCDQTPDARAAWGVAFDDNVANGCGTMSVSANFYYMTNGNQAPGCAWTSTGGSTRMRSVSLNTCSGPKGVSDIWHHSTSLLNWYSEGDGCSAHTVHTRVLSVASATYSADRTDNSCFRMWVGPEGNCLGADAGFDYNCQ